jgi:hypothetical protein
MRLRTWWGVLALLAAGRPAPPLVALAAEGRDLWGLPRFDLVAGTGDDAGYYAAAREFVSATTDVPLALTALAVLLVGAAVAAAVRLWPRGGLRPWLFLGVAGAVGVAVCLPILEMNPPGAPVFGWSLIWALPMFPLRALGVPLSYETAFFLALPLALAANVVALVATAYTGLYATGRRSVGLAAAGSLATWPLLTSVVGGSRAWDNGTWLVDTGLALYTEPLSTALVASAAALVLRPDRSDLHLVVAGALSSYATLVKVSNGFTALLLLLVVAGFLGLRRALPLAAGGLVFVPALAAYWPLGYAHEEGGRRDLLPEDPFSFDYGWRSWSDSLLFTPRALAILLPFAIVGALLTAHRRFGLAVLLVSILGNVAVYTFYWPTSVHPRFFFASLPALFVLWAAGALGVVDRFGASPAAGRPSPERSLH